MRHSGNFFSKVGWFVILLPLVLGIPHTNDAPANSFAQADPPPVMLPIIAGTQSGTNMYEMRMLGSIPGSFNTIAISGTLVFAGAQDGLSILDVTDPAQPNLRAHLPLAQGVAELKVADGYAYVIDGAHNLRTIDIRDNDNPELLGQYIAEDWIRSLQVVDGRAYVLQSSRLLIIDVSDPASPTRLSELTTWSIDLYAVTGNIVYIEHYPIAYASFSILDVSDPTEPVVLNTTAPQASASTAWHVDGHLFYTGQTHKYFFFDTLNISDISNPLQPVPHGFEMLPEGEYVEKVRGAGEVAYVLGQMVVFNTLYIYDVRERADLLDSYDLGEEPIVGMEVGGDRLYLLTGGRIDIYRFAIQTVGRGGKYRSKLTSTFDMTTYEFPPGAFTTTAELTHTVRLARTLLPLGERRSIGHAFETTAVYRDTGQPANPARPYSITVQYQDAERGPVVEESLALYAWEDGQWVREPGSTVDPDANTVTATPDHLGLWAVLGETNQTYLPLVD